MRTPSLFWPTFWAVPAFALLVALGVWQLERRAEKLALIAEIDEEMASPPVQMDVLVEAARKGERVAYRPVIVSGRFDHAHEIHVYVAAPVDPAGGAPGYHVITPLLRVSGPTVLVDRGYVPEPLKDPATRREGQVEGLATVRGVARDSSPPGLFTPKPDLAKNIWYSRDLKAMTAKLGLPDAAPFFVEADRTPVPGGWPRGGQTAVTLRNEHLGYALTWFGLAAALAGVYVVFVRRRRRGG